MFPPVNSGGLIEAYRWYGSTRLVLVVFPPVNSGGLIEAFIHRRLSWQP